MMKDLVNGTIFVEGEILGDVTSIVKDGSSFSQQVRKSAAKFSEFEIHMSDCQAHMTSREEIVSVVMNMAKIGFNCSGWRDPWNRIYIFKFKRDESDGLDALWREAIRIS